MPPSRKSRIDQKAAQPVASSFSATTEQEVEPGMLPPPSRHHAELRAVVAEEQLQLLVDSVKDYAIFMLDTQGRVQTWNTGAERIKGYRADEIIGQHISQFYPPEERAADKPGRLLADAERLGRIEEENWRVRKDGTRFWADVVISAVRDAQGVLRGFSKVTRDLTDRKLAEDALRASEERFRLLIDSVKDYAIFMLDTQGRVQTWNTGAERIKGYRADEIIGQHISQFYPPEERAADKPGRLLADAERLGRVEEENWRVRKDGTRFWADVVISAVRDAQGVLRGFSKVTRDLTDRKLAQEERLRLVQAGEAIRLRDEFLTVASHELKTPIAALQLQLELMRGKTLDPKVLSTLERATRSTTRLTTLVEALLDVARISTGRLELKLEPLDLSRAVNEVLEQHQVAAMRAGCVVSARIEPGVTGAWDSLRVEQAITNLLSNAFKYATGTPVGVALTSEGGDAVLEVADGGPGIPPEALSRIFARFERATSRDHYGGLGLGLYITREIVEAHGGSISARNLPGGGAAFTIRLPREPGSVLGSRAGSP
ncbi:PAS domain-containing sensor histidine kinase [Myxococcus sp. SDU36]|uniref:sensor histidine kinase n=1 Tax=Myxococcus sp. SDU36 TaxID=2831967 RepID=UPI0025433049|nr:PAS domain-containing sensor histidine kinase [Myxococcus sp. SDU36]WIG99507.1 PAS domain-containing sensor histidine kinase [Myxococcus sp. SDU36]